MPYLDGWQFLDEFTANTFNKALITIYICSSSNSRLDREKFDRYTNLEGYLLKPISKKRRDGCTKWRAYKVKCEWKSDYRLAMF